MAIEKGDVALYKSRRYRVLYAGSTPYGERVHLEFMNGDKSFWVDIGRVEETSERAPAPDNAAPQTPQTPARVPTPATMARDPGAAAAEENAVVVLSGIVQRLHAARPGTAAEGIPPRAPLGFAVRVADRNVDDLLGAYGRAREERNFFAQDAEALRGRLVKAREALSPILFAGDLEPAQIAALARNLMNLLTE